MSGVRTINVETASSVATLLGNFDGSTVQIPINLLKVLLGAELAGPNYQNRAELFADLAWSAGAVLRHDLLQRGHSPPAVRVVQASRRCRIAGATRQIDRKNPARRAGVTGDRPRGQTVKQPTLMQQTRVKVAEIDCRRRLRPISEAGVDSLIASIRETGVMKDAIHLRKKKDGSLVLIAGGHRLEAARRLGWEEIEAKIWTDVTDDWAAIMEIDDNLAGAEMNPLDTAVFLATRKQVYERLHPESKQMAGAALAAKRWSVDASDIVSFASATAEKFGVSKRHVERMVAAGTRLGPDEVAQLRAAPRQVPLAASGAMRQPDIAGSTRSQGPAGRDHGQGLATCQLPALQPQTLPPRRRWSRLR
ncbi:ParB/RepB/Spo0J family partition protein [Gemmobacter denitrificans]|uniref:ParB N-terminal domain-containing protein n=1 Tax=Gemmobacter denitrificans TaxID=3123040 RepID=A0ABU8BQW5_9RHOB